MKTYTTSEAARIIGVHPNTIRFYEDMGLVTKPERKENGYRVFTELHLEQFRLLRLAFGVEVLQNGLRKMSTDIVLTAAAGDTSGAAIICRQYLNRVLAERDNAHKAIDLTKRILRGDIPGGGQKLRRKEAAEYLGISTETLRGWERSNLLQVKRSENGYRVYTDEDLRLLMIIRSLRCANYSTAAILRMIGKLAKDSTADISAALDTPEPDEDIISACDKLLTSLSHAEKNAGLMMDKLEQIMEITLED